MRWAKRPFASVEEMDKEMIRRWNETVGTNDTVYHLGDFGFHSTAEQLDPILAQLNGKIHLILGNHDQNPNIETFAHWRITSFKELLKIRVGGQDIVLCHYPLQEWDGAFRGTWHLHGHSHNQWPISSWKQIDVGTDGHAFHPWSMQELHIEMSKRKIMTSEIYQSQPS